MGTVSTFTFTADDETVTRTKLNGLAANLLTEFNGNITNANISASAAIAASKLNLANIAQTVQFDGTFLVGAVHQGDIFYDNATTITRLTPGTSGKFLQTLGTGANPQWEYPVPIGVILEWTTNSAPTGWLLCDGSAVSRTTYSDLFTLISTTYGTGNGTTTFNLPNKKGVFSVGRDSSNTSFDVIGETGGVETVTLTAAQSGLVAHTHSLTMRNSNGAGTLIQESADSGGSGGQTTGSTGGSSASQAHTNLPPYIVTNYIIRY